VGDFALLHLCLQHLAQQQLVEKKHQLELVDQLKPVADELGCSLAQVRWHTWRCVTNHESACWQVAVASTFIDARMTEGLFLLCLAGLTVLQLALAWCAKNPNVSSVITGSTKVSQVRPATFVSFS
jgi:aryl-alcohol dehydrogenase-like predicted oxidoreductase